MDKAYQGFLKSRTFWRGTAFDMTQFDLPVTSIDFSNLPIVPTNRRLGHQAEFVFLQLLDACKDYTVLNHTIQLVEDKRTLGELDFIIQNIVTKEVLHVELTYKFYIIDKSIISPIDQIVGPNRKDTFVNKLNKTRNRQLPLLYSSPSKRILTEMELADINITQKVAFYAHIFLPYEDMTFDFDGLNEDCIAGYWVTVSQFQREDFLNVHYYRPSKTEWLHIPHHKTIWKNHEDIMDEIASCLHENRSVMLWKRKEIDNGIFEITRFFIC